MSDGRKKILAKSSLDTSFLFFEEGCFESMFGGKKEENRKLFFLYLCVCVNELECSSDTIK